MKYWYWYDAAIMVRWGVDNRCVWVSFGHRAQLQVSIMHSWRCEWFRRPCSLWVWFGPFHLFWSR